MPGSDQKTDRSRKRVRTRDSCTAALRSSNCASAKSDARFPAGSRRPNDVRPAGKTESRQAPRFQYFVNGRLAMRMDNGTERVIDSAVVDWFGATTKRSAEQCVVLEDEAIPGTNVCRCLGSLIIVAEPGDWIPGGGVADGGTRKTRPKHA